MGVERGKIANVLFAASHPVVVLKGLVRRTIVSIDHGLPPANSTIEEFANLSLAEAARLMLEAEGQSIKVDFGGIPESAWSDADLKRMKRGELPKGRPLHPNI